MTFDNYRQAFAGVSHTFIDSAAHGSGTETIAQGVSQQFHRHHPSVITYPDSGGSGIRLRMDDLPAQVLLHHGGGASGRTLQIALIPILRDYQTLGLTGSYLGIWLAHTGFGLPLGIYLLYNYISTIPRDIFESAFLDGARPMVVFSALVLPLSVPAIASLAIFQFLWVWNDLLVALVFLGGTNDVAVLTQRLATMVGSRGQDWHLLTAGAFIAMIVPLAVFFGLQRYFVQGLMAGSVKG